MDLAHKLMVGYIIEYIAYLGMEFNYTHISLIVFQNADPSGK